MRQKHESVHGVLGTLTVEGIHCASPFLLSTPVRHLHSPLASHRALLCGSLFPRDWFSPRRCRPNPLVFPPKSQLRVPLGSSWEPLGSDTKSERGKHGT